jgi:sensor histidine kinase regulating citrate/malate metabolism
LEALENVFRNQYLQYRQSKDNIDMINYKYHDLKHQIAVLRSEENPEKRKAYLDQMEEEIRRYEVENKTGNKVLDTVLTGKGITCAKNKITFTCVADGTLLDFMETADICSIFGNALDNAIEYERTIAEQEKRLIHVTVSRQKDFLMIRVENYFEGELQMEQGNLLTTKGNKELHGYGIKSIRYTAGKYDGVVEISTGDQWFTLQVMIPIPSTNSKENF